MIKSSFCINHEKGTIEIKIIGVTGREDFRVQTGCFLCQNADL